MNYERECLSVEFVSITVFVQRNPNLQGCQPERVNNKQAIREKKAKESLSLYILILFALTPLSSIEISF
jgi:hypothetical protein